MGSVKVNDFSRKPQLHYSSYTGSYSDHRPQSLPSIQHSKRTQEITMPPPKKGSVSTALQPMRLPPLPKLRVRRPNQADANPCLALMSSVLKTQIPKEKHHQPPPLPHVPQHRRSAKEEVK